MSPHADDDKKSSHENNPGKSVEGELKINHTPDQRQAEPEKAPIQTVKQEAPKVSAHEKVSVNEETLPSTENEKPNVIVPGGVSSATPNPSAYFRSKYRGKHPGKATSSQMSAPPSVPGGSWPQSANSATMQTAGRKRIYMAGGAAVLLILLIVGYIFGVYLPGKPENIYSNGLERTGKALDAVLDKTTEEDTLDKLLKTEVIGTFEAKIDDETITGDINGKTERSKLDINLNAVSRIPGQEDKKYTFNGLADLASDSSSASIYVNSGGLGYFGFEGLIPGLVNYDGKWVAVEGDTAKKLIRQYTGLIGDGLSAGPSSSSGTNAGSSLSNTDIAEISNAFADVAKEYLLTDDSSKAVLVNNGYVGKEETENGDAHRYTVGINRDNYAIFCKELSGRIIDSQAYQKMVGLDVELAADDKANAEASCDEAKESIDGSDTLDLWIDAKYKLIYKIRFTDIETNGTYLEVGQNYKGKNSLELFYNYVSESQQQVSKGLYSVDLKNYESNVHFDTAIAGKSPSSLIFSLNAKPLESSFEVQRPQGATSLDDIAKESGTDLNVLFPASRELEPTNAEMP